jgi:hypothetical protein
MSFHIPQDRQVHQKEKIEKEYKDAHGKLSQTKSELRAEEEGFQPSRKDESTEERIARFEADAEKLLDQTGKSVRKVFEEAHLND